MRGPVRNFNYRDVDIYRPWDDEIPRDDVGEHADPDGIRVAKLDGELIGGYHLETLGNMRFAVRSWFVHEPFRRHGVGHWLLGHALGLAESYGGRVVFLTPGDDPEPWLDAYLRRLGFEDEAGCLKFELTPE